MITQRLVALLLTLAMMPAAYAAKLANNTPGFVKKAVDIGAVDPSTVISVTAFLWYALTGEEGETQP